MTEDILHEATYPYPPEAVWRALSEKQALGAWLMETTFETPTVGHRFEFRDRPRPLVGWNGITACEVVEVVPFRRLVYRFGAPEDGSPSTVVAWDLEPVPEGTRLRLRHSGFTGFKGWMMRQGMNHGWGGMVRHAIPFVTGRLLEGRLPTRAETTEVRKRGSRGDHQATKASAPRS